MSRPLFTLTFWLDTLERTIRTFAQIVLGILTANNGPADGKINLSLAAWTTGTGTAICVLMCIIASGVNVPGTAGIAPTPVPPDTLKG